MATRKVKSIPIDDPATTDFDESTLPEQEIEIQVPDEPTPEAITAEQVTEQVPNVEPTPEPVLPVEVLPVEVPAVEPAPMEAPAAKPAAEPVEPVVEVSAPVETPAPIEIPVVVDFPPIHVKNALTEDQEPKVGEIDPVTKTVTGPSSFGEVHTVIQY